MAFTLRGPCPLLQVFDMDASIAFYRSVLGFEVAAASPGPDVGWVLLRRQGAELMLNTQHEAHERPPVPDPARAGIHADTCLYFQCEDLDGAYAHLQACGVNAEPPGVRPYGMRQLCFHDPDGYGLCLQWTAG